MTPSANEQISGADFLGGKKGRRSRRAEDQAIREARLIRQPGASMVIELHVETKNTLNAKMHHYAVAALRKKQRKAVAMELVRFGTRRPSFPCLVHITRWSKRTMDRGGLYAALKSIEDQVAEWLNVDDGAKDADKVLFLFHQERGEYRVTVNMNSVDKLPANSF